MLLNLNIGSRSSKNKDKEWSQDNDGKERSEKDSIAENLDYYENYKKILDELRYEFMKKWKMKHINKDVSLDDFQVLRTLGIGAFGRVKLIKHKQTSTYYAMKILEKRQLVKTKQIDHTRNEKRVLQSIDYPFVITLSYFCKDNSYLYIILPFINGGELFSYLRRKGKFPERQARFYAAQVVLALEYLHYCGLVYRDLKPENILLDREGYLKLIDFGFCKYIEGKRTWTLCGTPEYLAPEVILSKGYGKSVDWWSFGILIYEMNAGYAPFFSHDQMKIYEKIVLGKYKFPGHFKENLKSIVSSLLQTDLTRRFGNLKNGSLDIKKHVWFQTIDWDRVYHRKIKPSYIPVCKKDSDANNFDFYEEKDLKIDSKDLYHKEFADF
ncbi:cAMP-dependent protein kinase catalytic subunit beta-like [Chelonus insularis]|uniref:cAMP-dependent protein kinase catalytic subunit beta-like n=1 Tax=Chelonus insularis TaxID=460826 RepID=UPI00158A605E|nr:cAMP-dependent protein kinase catalytic subunit beta-like [Chelonus insularis]